VAGLEGVRFCDGLRGLEFTEQLALCLATDGLEVTDLSVFVRNACAGHDLRMSVHDAFDPPWFVTVRFEGTLSRT